MGACVYLAALGASIHHERSFDLRRKPEYANRTSDITRNLD
jgi:hypothetical protein